jgi:hypothetical protein
MASLLNSIPPVYAVLLSFFPFLSALKFLLILENPSCIATSDKP